MIHGMPFTMERFRALLRVERKARVGGRDRLAANIGVAKSTVQNAEMGPDVPGIDTVARLVGGMPGLTLAEFFAKVEEPAIMDPAADTGQRLASEIDDDSPQFESEERIAQTVLRRLARLALQGIEGGPPQREADYRLPPDARPHAADSSAPPRTNRTRHVPPRQKKRRPPKNR